MGELDDFPKVLLDYLIEVLLNESNGEFGLKDWFKSQLEIIHIFWMSDVS